ncbi:hypothetical protein HGB25_02530 [Candidatus Saccharibacteria bacterium]|nr:hypothetical protein [Candidatus Saccharibacteria bacterium]
MNSTISNLIPENKTAIICFKGNASEIYARKYYGHCNIYAINSSEHAIEQLLCDVDFSRYEYVIGIGQYSGRDRDKVRIEQTCSAQFRNKNRGAQRIPIPYFLKPDDQMKLADGIGNSYCNLLSYKIVTNFPDIKYTFLHIPVTLV